MAKRSSIRVLFVINSLGGGGTEVSLAEILPHLAETGIEASIACLRPSADGVQEMVASAGFPLRPLDGTGLPSWIRSMRRLLKVEQPDIVHTALFESDIVGRLAAAGGRAIVVSSLVNTSYDTVRLADPNIRPFRLRMARAIDAWTARRLTAHFHAVSATVKSAAVQALGIRPERVTVIQRGRNQHRLGVRTQERRRRVRALLGLAENAQVIVAVGRQEFQKGHRYLFEAVARLGPTFPTLVQVVAGREGNASRELRDLQSRLGLGDRLRVLGHRDDIPDVLCASDLFVLPSLYEGSPGALIEAMALGLPIVASDIGAVREMVDVGKNALLVPPAAPRLLAQALETLLRDEDMRLRFGAHSLELFRGRITLSQSAQRLAAVYRRLLHGREGLPVDSGKPQIARATVALGRSAGEPE